MYSIEECEEEYLRSEEELANEINVVPNFGLAILLIKTGEFNSRLANLVAKPKK